MKRNIIAAAILSIASFAAFASPVGSGGAVAGAIAGQAQIAGQYTEGTVSAGLSASSQTSGNAVSATKVYGPNAYSTQSTVSTGNGDATAGVNLSPSQVSTYTSQNASTNVVSNANQSAQLPTLDNAGLLVNGTAGVSQVTNNAQAVATQVITGKTGAAAIEGSAGIIAVGGVAGW